MAENDYFGTGYLVMGALISFVRSVLRDTLANIGLEYREKSKNPKISLLGVRHMGIRSIIDVGANQGQFAEYISEVFPKADLYCFEPLPAAFQDLKTWGVAALGDRFRAFNMAIGDTEGTVEMFYHTDHSPSSSLLSTTDVNDELYPMTKKQRSIVAPISTLDQALDELLAGMPREIMVKLDVQGYEDRVIRGGCKVLSQAKVVILEVCLDALYKHQAKFRDIVVQMDELGYSYAGNFDQNYGDDGHVIFFDAVFIK